MTRTIGLPASAAGWRAFNASGQRLLDEHGYVVFFPLPLDECRAEIAAGWGAGRYRLEAVDGRGRRVAGVPVVAMTITAQDVRNSGPLGGFEGELMRRSPTTSGVRAALYHRVSTVDQDRHLAAAELRAAARVRGLKVVLDVEETGTGARNDRPGLMRVLDAARRGQIDWVLVWKLDRWGRSALDLLSNVRELQGCGVRFVAVTQGLEVRAGGDSLSGLVLGVLAAVAEFERDLIVERTRLGLAKARRRGRRLGRPPTLAQPDARKVARLRREKKSWAAIAAELGCAPTSARRALARLVDERAAKRKRATA